MNYLAFLIHVNYMNTQLRDAYLLGGKNLQAKKAMACKLI